jgi:hypothetical protein
MQDQLLKPVDLQKSDRFFLCNKHLAELALIRAIPDLTIGELKPSRVKGLFLRLQKHVDKDLQRLPRPSEKDLDDIWNIVETFGQQTGWLQQKKHTGTLISFCLGIVETSDFDFCPGVIKTLNDLIGGTYDKIRI